MSTPAIKALLEERREHEAAVTMVNRALAALGVGTLTALPVPSPTSNGDRRRGPRSPAVLRKMRRAQRRWWNNMTPKERKAVIAKMQAWRQ